MNSWIVQWSLECAGLGGSKVAAHGRVDVTGATSRAAEAAARATPEITAAISNLQPGSRAVLVLKLAKIAPSTNPYIGYT